jgi:hypothetical protein
MAEMEIIKTKRGNDNVFMNGYTFTKDYTKFVDISNYYFCKRKLVIKIVQFLGIQISFGSA